MADDMTLDVYWRPGCGFCVRLFDHLDRAGVVPRLHNIWEDAAARAFVASHNGGNETVPTVALGRKVMTNPRPEDLVALLDDLGLRRHPHHPHHPNNPDPPHQPDSRDHPGRRSRAGRSMWARVTGRAPAGPTGPAGSLGARRPAG